MLRRTMQNLRLPHAVLFWLLCLFTAALRAEPIAITNVHVIDVVTASIDRDRVVVLDGAMIVSIGDEIPAGARILDARDGYLLPGFIDMHVHLRPGQADDYLRYGITTVREMAGIATARDVASAISNGSLAGPRVILGTPLIDGANPTNPTFAVSFTNPLQAGSFVDEWLQRGATFMKVYNRLGAEPYRALVAEAHARGARVTGHVPEAVPIREAILRQDCTEHLIGYQQLVSTRSGADGWIVADLSQFDAAVTTIRSSGVWSCPTLEVDNSLVSNWSPANAEVYIRNRREFVRRLAAAGAPLLIGTDAGYLLPPGSSFKLEIDEFVTAGVPIADVLRFATIDAARYLRLDHEIGSIEAGKRADLVLVRQNPYDDINTIARPSIVIHDGRVFDYARRRAVRPGGT